jgi:hypothetical protein
LREQAAFIGRQAKRRLGGSAKHKQPGEAARIRPGEEGADASDGNRRVIRWDITDAYHRIMECYIPREYGGKVTLLWPDEAASEPSNDPTMGWGRVAREVEVHSIAGKHLTCITRHADSLAGRLRISLEKAGAADRP